ncbi:MAG: aspartate aminotransferase family protein, partial [Acidobacteriota bacterium]
ANGVHRLQLYSGGAEAVESALRLAKSHTGKYEFVSCWGGFHGKTMGALSLMGSTFKDKLGPMVPGSHQVPYADCYRCPLQLKYDGGKCGIACAEVARSYLKVATAGSVAAMIIEPMQGTAGNIIPPKEFLPAMKSIADELGALFIADEMITGLGRTGTWWGTDHTGVVPDIVTIGKAVGGGFPLSALATTDEISKAKPWSNASGSSSSYGGNPLAAAAGAASLRVIEEEALVENSRRVGAVMLKELETWPDRYPFVGIARGSGMFMALELVTDKKTKEPLAKTITQRIFNECVRRGLLTMSYSPHFRIQPPLTTDEATAKNGLAILKEVFDLVEREGWWRS